MKNAIVTRLGRVAPRLTRQAVSVKRRLPVTYGRSVGMAEQIERLRDEVKALREEVDETRRDALRIAELTDIVEERLATSTPGQGA